MALEPFLALRAVTAAKPGFCISLAKSIARAARFVTATCTMQDVQLSILDQGSTAPADPPGAGPSAPASQRMAGGSPLHFMSLPVHNTLHCTKAGGRPPQHQDPDRGLPPTSRRPCRTLSWTQAWHTLCGLLYSSSRAHSADPCARQSRIARTPSALRCLVARYGSGDTAMLGCLTSMHDHLTCRRTRLCAGTLV